MYLSLFFASIESGGGETFSFLRELLQLCATLAAVLALAFVTLVFVRRVVRSRAVQLNSGAAIKIIEKRSLHPKASLYLIEVLGKGIVIAESSLGIHMLSELDPEINVSALVSDLQNQKSPPSNFSLKLKELIKSRRS